MVTVGGPLELFAADDLNAVLTHQTANAALADADAKFVQLLGHARSAVSVYTQHDLDQVALRLNTRPRKTLGFQTPADTFERAVALTG